MNWKLFIIFLIINFGALGLGGWLQGEGARSEWYQELNKAPWTPPGWVFGAAWTSIMLCFSFYMAKLVTKDNSAMVWTLFVVQFLLNVFWNPIFFRWLEVTVSLVMITALLLLTVFFLIYYNNKLGWYSLLMLPYTIWLIVATSLNAFVLYQN